MANQWTCPKCNKTESFFSAWQHECEEIDLVTICPNCWLTKPCECDDD